MSAFNGNKDPSIHGTELPQNEGINKNKSRLEDYDDGQIGGAQPSFCRDFSFLFQGPGLGHGGVVVSNVFLFMSLIYLANEAAGCLDDEDEVDEECTNKVYGMTPSNVVANIAVLSGIIVAILLPVIGVMIDYADRARRLMATMAVSISIIQAVQIGTSSRSWFVMSALQVIALVLAEFQMMITSSLYRPTEIRRKDISEKGTAVGGFCAEYTIGLVYSSDLLFVFVTTSISVCFGLSNVRTAQVSQAINAIWSGSVYFFLVDLAPAGAS